MVDETVVFVLVLALVLLFGWCLRALGRRKRTIAGKAWVVDADDIKVNGLRIRLAGVDAPEHRQLAQRNGRWYNQGKWVKGKLIRAIGGRAVEVEIHHYDKFGRAIGVVFCEGKDVGEWMVRNGLAIAAYSDKYRDCEYRARQERRGIWGDRISYDPKHWKHGKRVPLC